jgi:hypothetical protein
MTSSINPNNIDGNYPVAGVPNNTQGFRDNFTNTKTNFQYAADEINDLQSKAVLKQALTGTTLDNNMNDNLIYAVKMNDVSFTALQQTATAGSITIDYAAAAWQSLAPTGNVSLAFTNWPASGSYGVVNLEMIITNTAYTLTLPTSVTQGLLGLAGWDSGTRTISFYQTGQFRYSFSSVDGGASIQITDFDRPRNVFFSQVNISNTTPSTSTTTGALIVAGGAGIGANLNVGGNLKTFTSTGNVAFSALDTGFVNLNVPAVPANTAGALNIVGSTTGAYQPVYNAGSMFHITGNDGESARVTVDTFGTSVQSAFVQRLARGTAAAPTAVQSGDIVARITGSGYGTSQYALAAGNIGTLGIDFVAMETYTNTAAGSALKFYTSPIGVVTKTLSANVTANVTTFPANVAAANVVVSGTGGVFLTDGGTVGYGVGGGGTVSQTGNKSTGVTLNKPSGQITMQNTNLAADTSVSFTLTNSTIGTNDLLLLNIVGGVATPGTYNLDANCTTGSATITVRNITGGTLGEAIVLRYAVIKGSVT